MIFRLYKAYTPGTRNRSISDFEGLTRYKPTKKLTYGRNSKNGRNNRGIITSRHKGGGHKRLYRKIDFRRNKIDISGRIASIEYDPNRNAYICLINYVDGEKRYILHTRGISVGNIVIYSSKASISIGNALPLSTNIPLGTIIHNIEIIPGRGGQLARAAGTTAKVIAKEGRLATSRLPSGEVRSISQNCIATVGRVGNVDTNNRYLGKAGSKRWLGKRPRVRGAAMNPVDHPHGGGEGRTPIGRKRPSTPWGYTAFGRKSRKYKRYSNSFIIRRRKTK
uniref:Large ribosomal subunit protein uL2c n=1 Tax=Trichomanes trollii TaxID=1481379 RepID=A0A410YES8_9MONI|nr:ribosomal protein L2 [Trichomanes trollii]QAV57700.1 ribosomal protein L2 [Trichomanes trollii]